MPSSLRPTASPAFPIFCEKQILDGWHRYLAEGGRGERFTEWEGLGG